jgi:KipI family sensor histidine kinase inhibitor
VVDIVLPNQSAAVFANPDAIDLARLARDLRALRSDETARAEGRLIVLPVLYDGEDLPDVARRLGMTENAVVAEHSGHVYQVFAVGFLPGFPYAGYLPATLRGLPRRDVPRLRVPAGSVAVAGRQTGVYPDASPGGWHLIGRTPLRIVDLEQARFPIEAGDRLRFEPISLDEYETRRDQPL